MDFPPRSQLKNGDSRLSASEEDDFDVYEPMEEEKEAISQEMRFEDEKERHLFTCVFKNCPSSYAKFKELKNHMNLHGRELDFHCDVCKRLFFSYYSAVLHIQQRENRECCECGEKFPSFSEFTRHLHSHIEDNQITMKMEDGSEAGGSKGEVTLDVVDSPFSNEDFPEQEAVQSTIFSKPFNVKEEVYSDVEQDDVKATEGCDSGKEIDPVVDPSTATEQEVQTKSVAEEPEEEPNFLGEKEEDEQRIEGGYDLEMAVDDLLESSDADDSMIHSIRNDHSLAEGLLEQEAIQSTDSTENVVQEENGIFESELETPPVAVQTVESVEARADVSMSLKITRRLRSHTRKSQDTTPPVEARADVSMSLKIARRLRSHTRKSQNTTPPIAVQTVESVEARADVSTSLEITRRLRSHTRKSQVTMKIEDGSEDDGSKPLKTVDSNENKTVARLLFTCPLKNCPSSYNKFNGLKEHMKMHSGKKNFFCDVCKKRFSSKKAAMRHIEERMKKKCCGCGKRNVICLLKHLRSHTGEKPYPCGYCERRFAYPVDRENHEYTHTGEKPYECSHCGRKFGQRAHLTKHRRIHTGEKPYSCEECEKKFSRNDNLKDHMKRMHKS